jgi:Icc-related predicted phosphoesterase
MLLAAASDIHGEWSKLNYPEADVLVFAGDILNDYSRDFSIAALQQIPEIKELNLFFGELLRQGIYKDIIMVAGNHDHAFARVPEAKKLLTNAHYLQDAGAIVQGVKFYGSPWQPFFGGWAFNLPDGDPRYGNFHRAKAYAQRCWAAIHENTEVLITHGPPQGTLDQTYGGQMVGCPYLEDRIEELPDLKLHIFGHIHYSHGHITKRIQLRKNGFLTTTEHPVQFVNAAICATVTPVNPIQLITI